MDFALVLGEQTVELSGLWAWGERFGQGIIPAERRLAATHPQACRTSLSLTPVSWHLFITFVFICLALY